MAGVPLQVTTPELIDVNRMLLQVRDELDKLNGKTQTITGQKTFKGVAMRIEDSNGQLIHAMGTST